MNKDESYYTNPIKISWITDSHVLITEIKL